jgi:hypothetical protein
VIPKKLEVVEAAGVVLGQGVENKELGRFHFLSNHVLPLKWLDLHM